MPVDIHVARPFIFNSPAGRFEFGIAVYPAMDDAFAADPWVAAHLEDAVVARGGTLFQFRTTITGLKPVPIFLGPVNAQWFTPTIEAGWDPIFRDDLSVDLENPGIDDPNQPNPSGRDWAVGRHSSLMRDEANEQLETVKLFPGDASPPVSRAADTTPPVVLDSAGFPVSPANKAHMMRRAGDRADAAGRPRACREGGDRGHTIGARAPVSRSRSRSRSRSGSTRTSGHRRRPYSIGLTMSMSSPRARGDSRVLTSRRRRGRASPGQI